MVIIITAVACFFIGTLYGWLSFRYFLRKNFLRAIQKVREAEEIQEEDPPANIMRINLEKHGDIIYAYDSETDIFLAQGKNREDIEEHLTARFPGKVFHAPDEQIKKCGL